MSFFTVIRNRPAVTTHTFPGSEPSSTPPAIDEEATGPMSPFSPSPAPVAVTDWAADADEPDDEATGALDMPGLFRDAPTGRIAAVGQVFSMNMTWTDGTRVAHYITDNHITAFDEGRVIEWMPAAAGKEPWGWRWRYDLEPLHHDNSTRVTLTYDWTRTSPDDIEKYHVPEFAEDDLKDSLRLLDLAVISGAHTAE